MNFLKLNVVDALPSVTSADAGARVLFENSIYVVTSAGAWKEVSPDKGYLEYEAQVSQESTNAPTAIVNVNELGVNITFTRFEDGVYGVQNVPTGDNVSLEFIPSQNVDGLPQVVQIVYGKANNNIFTTISGTPTDDILFKSILRIKVYPV